jgi:hypothetical protein
VAIIERREASWTAAVLRRFFDGPPEIEFHPTPAATFNRFMGARAQASSGPVEKPYDAPPFPASENFFQ